MSLVSELYKEVSYLGITGDCKTIQQYFSWLKKAPVLFVPEKLNYNKTTKQFAGKNKLFSDTIAITSGSFGTIQLSYLESPDYTGYVFLKQSKKQQTSLIIEGLLQSSAHVVLKRYGFSYAIPRVLSIVSMPDSGITILLQRMPNAKLFADYLKNNFRWNQPCVENDTLILQIISQVASYIAILEYELGMNHRDLKSTNVLMITPVEPYSSSITLGPRTWRFTSTIQVNIIDFGFTCVGTPEGNSILSAGNYLPEIDFCPKEGRDLFLFFASLWAIPAFRESLSEKLRGLFEGWLQDSKQKSWADWLCLNEKDNLMSMYLLCSSSEFSSPPCVPIRILQDIHMLAPSIVPFLSLGRPVTPIPFA